MAFLDVAASQHGQGPQEFLSDALPWPVPGGRETFPVERHGRVCVVEQMSELMELVTAQRLFRPPLGCLKALNQGLDLGRLDAGRRRPVSSVGKVGRGPHQRVDPLLADPSRRGADARPFSGAAGLGLARAVPKRSGGQSRSITIAALSHLQHHKSTCQVHMGCWMGIIALEIRAALSARGQATSAAGRCDRASRTDHSARPIEARPNSRLWGTSASAARSQGKHAFHCIPGPHCLRPFRGGRIGEPGVSVEIIHDALD